MRAREWQSQCVSLDPACAWSVLPGRSRFRGGPLQHGMRKVGAQNLRPGLPCLPAQSERHVSRATTQIEDAGVRANENVPEPARRPPPPQAVDIERQDVIQ